MTGYYIIEHPTRGTLADLEFEDFERDGDRYKLVDGRRVPIYKARFSTAASRTDERTERFYGIRAAREALAKIPERIRLRCQIRLSPDWHVISPVGDPDPDGRHLIVDYGRNGEGRYVLRDRRTRKAVFADSSKSAVIAEAQRRKGWAVNGDEREYARQIGEHQGEAA